MSDDSATRQSPPDLAAAPSEPPDERLLIYTSAELLRGRREVWIRHGGQMYRLRLTSANRLYLTK